MSTDTRKQREFTGRHMLIVIVSFFAVVIGVNVTMATLAESILRDRLPVRFLPQLHKVIWEEDSRGR